jgi:CheY-like chemotaxis protein
VCSDEIHEMPTSHHTPARSENGKVRRPRGEEITVPEVLLRGLRRVAYVVDDSDDARDLFGDALRDSGYRVVEARDGREAMDLLLEHPTPSAIVLDLCMPLTDGYEVLDLLASYTRLTRVPTLVVTASCEEVELRVPFAKCLRKPVDVDELVQVLDELVAAAEQRQ